MKTAVVIAFVMLSLASVLGGLLLRVREALFRVVPVAAGPDGSPLSTWDAGTDFEYGIFELEPEFRDRF